MPPTKFLIYEMPNGRYECRSVEYDFRHVAKRGLEDADEVGADFLAAWADLQGCLWPADRKPADRRAMLETWKAKRMGLPLPCRSTVCGYGEVGGKGTATS